MKYNKITWGLLVVMAVLMVAAVGQNMGLFAFGATSFNADVYQEGDTVIVNYVYTSTAYQHGNVAATFAGQSQARDVAHGTTSGTFTFTAPTAGRYDVVLTGKDVGYKNYGQTRITTNVVTKTLSVVVVEEKPDDYCVGNALYTDFVLVDGEWKPTPVINSPICGYTAPPPVDDITPDEPPVDDAEDTTMFMFIALAGILVIGIVGIAYIKKR